MSVMIKIMIKLRLAFRTPRAMKGASIGLIDNILCWWKSLVDPAPGYWHRPGMFARAQCVTAK